MDPGDVYLTDIPLPDRTAGVVAGVDVRSKLAVVLQGGPNFAGTTDVAIVIASTRRNAGRPARPFEVLVGPADGFHHDTIIDCRWPTTVHRQTLLAGRRLLQLTPARIRDIRVALVHGLQLNG